MRKLLSLNCTLIYICAAPILFILGMVVFLNGNHYFNNKGNGYKESDLDNHSRDLMFLDWSQLLGNILIITAYILFALGLALLLLRIGKGTYRQLVKAKPHK